MVINTDSNIIANVDFCIHNGGVKINISDDPEKGRTLNITAEHFGHQTAGMSLHINEEKFKELIDMFKKAEAHKFQNKDYIFAIHK